MDDHVAKIHYNPAITRITLFLSFSFVFLTNVVNGAVGKRVKHAVTGTGANDEVIGKGCYFFYIHQDDVFALLVFQGVNDVTSKI